jgi:hypothetical protein
MDIIGKNQWVCIPDEKGCFDEPLLLQEGVLLTSNFDEIKIKHNLDVDYIERLTEKEIYQELISGRYNLGINAQKLFSRAKELGIY